VEAFVDKFLLGKDTTNTNISTNPGYTTDLSRWITWTTPALSNGTSSIEWTSLRYPSDLQTDLDTNITFRWKKVQDAERYFIQVSLDRAFTNLDKSDSTITDTVRTFTGLLKGKQYYWRVKVKSAAATNLWSNVWSFKTTTPLPAMPQLVSATPTYANRADWITLKWNKVQYADQYSVQISQVQTFTSIFKLGSTSDTVKSLSGLSRGQVYYWRVQANSFAGPGPWSDVWNFTAGVTGFNEERIPTEYSIGQNYPNPFNPTTAIEFSLPIRTDVRLALVNLLGQVVKEIADGSYEAGIYKVRLDASHLASGMYFYRMEAGGFTSVKKLVLTK
jgi:hypothetical protein